MCLTPNWISIAQLRRCKPTHSFRGNFLPFLPSRPPIRFGGHWMNARFAPNSHTYFFRNVLMLSLSLSLFLHRHRCRCYFINGTIFFLLRTIVLTWLNARVCVFVEGGLNYVHIRHVLPSRAPPHTYGTKVSSHIHKQLRQVDVWTVFYFFPLHLHLRHFIVVDNQYWMMRTDADIERVCPDPASRKWQIVRSPFIVSYFNRSHP